MKVIRPSRKKTYYPFYQRKVFWQSLTIFILLIIIIYLILFSRAFERERLTIEGNEIIPSNIIKEISQNFFDRQITDSLIWPINSLKKELKETLPYINEVKIIRKWPHEIIISLVEKTPKFCLEISEDFSFLIDKNAAILETINGKCSSDIIIIKFINSMTEFESLKQDYWSVIHEINNALSMLNLKLEELQIEDLRINAMIRNSILEQPSWWIKFNLTFDLQKQLERLKLFLKTRNAEEIESIDYIDLGSHEERIFYVNRDK